jgi:hypothetical protein
VVLLQIQGCLYLEVTKNLCSTWWRKRCYYSLLLFKRKEIGKGTT